MHHHGRVVVEDRLKQIEYFVVDVHIVTGVGADAESVTAVVVVVAAAAPVGGGGGCTWHSA